MNGKTLASLLFAALCVLSAAQASRAQVFYSVVSPDGGRNWLLGTIHSEDERVLDFPPVLRQALSQTDTVALELVPEPKMLQRLADAMLLPEEEKLSDRLDAALFRSVRAALTEYGMTSESVDRLRPWAAALTLAQPPVRTGRFMDLVLARQAAEYGATAIGLETVDEQLAFFTGLGEQAHVALLRQAVIDRERGMEDFEALVQAYLGSDLLKLQRLAKRQLSELPESVQESFRVQGLVERNVEMARRAQPLLDNGKTLIAVGALHLPGDQGMIALLRQQGNRVEEIY